jgi:hypothetical protein
MAAGSREPKQRQRPLPPKIRQVLDAMVFGRLDDENCAPLSFIEAAKLFDVDPCVMRRWLDRSQARAYLLSQRRAFRAALCSGNELALLDIRQNAANSMARIAAVRTLEELQLEDTARKPSNYSEDDKRLVIKIVNEIRAPIAPPTVNAVDVTPTDAPKTFAIVPER